MPCSARVSPAAAPFLWGTFLIGVHSDVDKKTCDMFLKAEIVKIKSLNGQTIEVELNFICINSVYKCI